MEPAPQGPNSDNRPPKPLGGYLRWVFLLSIAAAIAALWFRPINLSERFQTGLEAVKRADWQTARLCAADLMKDEEHHAHAFLLTGYEQRARRRSKDAYVTFSKARSHPETRELAFHEAASILYEVGEYSQVILMCQKVLQWNAERTDTRRLLAAAYYDIGAMIQAINALRVVIEQQPNDHRPHYMQASILHDFERFGDAALAYEQAAKRITKASTVRDEVLAGWGACLVRLRRHKEALEVLKPAASWPDIETQRAVALFELRQPDAALKAAETALRQQPLHPDATTVAARCYELAGDVEKGIALLQESAAQHPLELELHLRLADMLSANAQPERGLEHRKTAAKISDYRRDFSHKQQALVHNDNDATLRFEIAELAEKLGKIEIARSWLRAAAGMTTATEEIRSYWQQFQERHPPGPKASTNPGQAD
ncbi:MAG: tetratricopeptide repeat protein [Fuerstiella sp.]|nr:tetratricopeptide repeat protein [Fuerstiella sp.]MCP4856772.1 tetratricopeptide repeat protein [Fuerstiella sp.]